MKIIATALTLAWGLFTVDVAKAQTPPLFRYAPRVRREWRTLSPATRQAVADAFRVLKTVETEEGRQQYGDLFWNLDDLTMLHACAIKDPRCDQGHYGPQFMTFHRAYLLRLENALLAVDSSIEALPYWDYSRDTESGDCFQKDCYIFSDDYFGDVQGNPNENYAVTNGLFAYWPVTEYTVDRFGSSSPLNVECTNNEYFKGFVATDCLRCCGQGDECVCDQGGDVFPHYLRDHDDCTPYVARNPDEQLAILDTNELLGTHPDFDACSNPDNINSHMGWQNCIEFEQTSCLIYLGGLECEESVDAITELLPEVGAPPFFVSDFVKEKVCVECTLEGFYFEKDTNIKQKPQSLHSQAHIRLARDILDVTTSPNDPSVFSGYHANLDRNHMTWMMNTYDRLSQDNWGYPVNQNDWGIQNLDRLSGPWSSYDLLICAADTETHPDYEPFKNAWLEGTLADDTCNGAFPFDDLWEEPPANGIGYTHAEILYYSDPSRTVYTYDTLKAEHYCNTYLSTCETDSDCCDGYYCWVGWFIGGRCKVQY